MTPEIPLFPKPFPQPSIPLRATRQPLFDTELIQPFNAGKPVRFFCRPQGSPIGREVKTEFETNLVLPGQLRNPEEFSLFGFAFDFHCLPNDDRRMILTGSLFQFTYIGHRIYLSVPGRMIPSVTKEDVDLLASIPIGRIFAPDMQGSDPKTTEDEFKKAQDPKQIWDENADYSFHRYMHELRTGPISLYNFTVGTTALRLRPTESFGCDICWKPGFVPMVPQTGMKITCYLIGYHWEPL